ncbi:MAG: glycosyltransferase [Eubacteriales bacterium]|nr:glycosyltransferase [Eubacteriales bacterium]
MKKILFMIPTLDQGGAEKVLVNLVNNMDKEKYDITVLTLFGGGINRQFLKPHVKNGYCIKRIFPGNSKFFCLFSPRFLFKYFIKEKYDIIVSYLEGPTARIVSGCTDEDTKLVSWIHVQQETKSEVTAAFRSFREADKCYKRFDKTICVSNYVKKNFTDNFRDINNVEVLYNTNETEKIQELSKEPVDDYAFYDGKKTVISIGTLKKSKGFDRLVRIHKRLIDEGVLHNIIVLGRGPEKENLKQLIEKNGVTDSFRLLGYNTNPYKYIRNSDLFVCASFAEGFSTAATESLIVGTPVVTVDVSGMKEMLGEHNEYGIVTENDEDSLYSGIKMLLTDDNKYNYYEEKASERGKFFNTKSTVNSVQEMLDSL